ncbi:hypothetical protein SPRG_11849 [Saprolegnia parasitica CBS 223.65]|uniref:HSF-type DNA-binding domain-containing protein n=1 Tax=Saprolegnia parasitica (strain CBS 223.65) TaxID=695850 RepID=A0A067BXJ1_SAPPC|nr:hypothetical protein SPRG_11849 [Saprolegnia parasitica CBS 223.65]KDO23003.1 hypothetical protein SPRG_11849 [Saprolegnia parasitica CBS 223.65]|eukprot:XP_012206291.1 hypothetical protein SPRG_11849 [Saprolegnia parasitica CBS 223.65]
MNMQDDLKRKRITGIPKFLRSLYRMLETEDPSVITWSHDGSAIQILSERRLETEILRKYFNHEKASSFQRQLNNFGFRKWTKTQSNVCTFSHPSFLRTQPELLVHVVRKSPRASPQSASPSHSATSSKSNNTSNSPTTIKTEYTPDVFTFDDQHLVTDMYHQHPAANETKLIAIECMHFLPTSSTTLCDVFTLDDHSWDLPEATDDLAAFLDDKLLWEGFLSACDAPPLP